MTKNNKYKNTILTSMIALTLLTSAIAVGGIQNAYAGEEFCGAAPVPNPSIDPSEIRETASPGDQIDITKFIIPNDNECFRFDEIDNVNFGENCFEGFAENMELVVAFGLADPTEVKETVFVDFDAEPGEYHCDVIFTLIYSEDFNASESILIDVTQPIWITVPEPEVDIDIKPGSFPNSINTKSMGLVPVAILGSADFDVTEIDVTTLAFGPNGAAPAHDLSDPETYDEHLQDVNDDGFLDLVSHYNQKEVGLCVDDTEATISGTLLDGTPFEGTDSVRPLHAPDC